MILTYQLLYLLSFHRTLLEKELESVGIRLNKRPPDIYFKVSAAWLWWTFEIRKILTACISSSDDYHNSHNFYFLKWFISSFRPVCLYVFMYMYVYMYVCLYACLSVCMPVCLSVYLYLLPISIFDSD